MTQEKIALMVCLLLPNSLASFFSMLPLYAQELLRRATILRRASRTCITVHCTGILPALPATTYVLLFIVDTGPAPSPTCCASIVLFWRNKLARHTEDRHLTQEAPASQEFVMFRRLKNPLLVCWWPNCCRSCTSLLARVNILRKIFKSTLIRSTLIIS